MGFKVFLKKKYMQKSHSSQLVTLVKIVHVTIILYTFSIHNNYSTEQGLADLNRTYFALKTYLKSKSWKKRLNYY